MDRIASDAAISSFFNRYIVGKIQVCGGKVPDRTDAAGYERVGSLLRGRLGHRDDADEHVQPLYHVRYFLRIEHGHAVDLFADKFGVRVERGDDVQPVVAETAVPRERAPQSARADEHRVGHVVVAQKPVDVRNEVGDLEA